VTESEKSQLEKFVAEVIDAEPLRLMKCDELQKAGHDLAMLELAVRHYSRLPLTEREFVLRIVDGLLIVARVNLLHRPLRGNAFASKAPFARQATG
jgi:hypothetical protein